MASQSPSEEGSRDLPAMADQLSLSDTGDGGMPPPNVPHPPTLPPSGESHAPSPEAPPPGEDHAPKPHDSGEEEEEEEEPLTQSVGLEDEVGKLLRTTVEELESALQVRELDRVGSKAS